MLELDKEQFASAAPLFCDAPHNKPVVFSVIERHHPGRVFVDDREHPTLAVVAFDDYIFLAGTDAAIDRSFYDFLRDAVVAGTGLEYFEFYTYAEPLYKKASDLLKGDIVDNRIRKTFHLDINRYKKASLTDGLPKGFRMEYIDAQFVDKHHFDKAFWSPVSQRFGYCLLDGEEIISQCMAVFVGAGMAELGIDTHEGHRRRGFAMLLASAFIGHCLANNLTPNWTCWDFRDASIALAHKLGFEHVNDTPVLVLKF